MIFSHIWNCKKWILVQKYFVKLIYLIWRVVLDWTFFKFLAHCGLVCYFSCIHTCNRVGGFFKDFFLKFWNCLQHTQPKKPDFVKYSKIRKYNNKCASGWTQALSVLLLLWGKCWRFQTFFSNIWPITAQISLWKWMIGCWHSMACLENLGAPRCKTILYNQY